MAPVMRSGPVGVRALAVLESAIGYAFGGAFYLLGALRRSKPLHPRGAMFPGPRPPARLGPGPGSEVARPAGLDSQVIRPITLLDM